jgi:hypothetical protein
MDQNLSADKKYYASSQTSTTQPGSDVSTKVTSQGKGRKPTHGGVDSTDKYYANDEGFTVVDESSTLPEVTGETESISDVSDIPRVLDSVSVLFRAGTTTVRIPVMVDLMQKARTNLELRVGREELTFDQAAGVNFVLLDSVVASPEVEEESQENVIPDDLDEADTDVDDEEEEEVVEDLLEEEEVTEDAPTSEELLDASNKDDTPSIASLFGATDDDDDDGDD